MSRVAAYRSLARIPFLHGIPFYILDHGASYSLANVARATLPIRAVLYEITTRFAEEAIANWSTARPTRIAKRAEAPAAANPATHTATENKAGSSRHNFIALLVLVMSRTSILLSRLFSALQFRARDEKNAKAIRND